MERFAVAAEAIASSSRKTDKVQVLAEYFRARPTEDAATSAIFFSGRPFAAWEQTTLQVGSSLLVRVILEIAGKPETALLALYRRTGDLGTAACQLLSLAPPLRYMANADRHRSGQPDSVLPEPLGVADAACCFREIAALSAPAAKAARLRQLLVRAQPLEVKYLIKIMTGEMRIGLRESLVEEAIAAAYGAPLAQVQRANMLLGDIGETLDLAAAKRLGDAKMRMFHPLGFMLASPIESSASAFENLRQALVEDKYDGIRAQAHCSQGEVRLFSRTLDEVTASFPELIEPLSLLDDTILDGEIVAWNATQNQAMPFSELQKRLGRKSVSAAVRRAVPVAFVAFDVLYGDGKLLIDRTLEERGAWLDRLLAAPHRSLRAGEGGAHATRAKAADPQGVLAFEPAIRKEAGSASSALIIRAPGVRVSASQDLESLFLRAQARGNEGLMIKDLASLYAPGRRGRSWLKMKRELATLDVVVTSVEWGHGKRIGVLSDYTFAVRDTDTPPGPQAIAAQSGDEPTPVTRSGEPLLNIGKAYSGLTDAEIAEMTEWFLQHTLADHGFWRTVEPTVVVEVAFNAIMRSDRHSSGYALRFPRILRLRRDKAVEEADTLERARRIFESQLLPRSA